MSDPNEAIDELMDQAMELDEGPAQIALIEEAVRLADLHQDTVRGWELRQDLVRAATFGGQPDVAVVAFSWLLAQADRDPEKFDESDLLWQYKWVIEDLPDFPHISRQQIDELFADMARRYERHGSTLHAVHQIRRDVAVAMNDRAEAEAAHARFLAVKTDALSNCKACVQDALIDYQLFLGDDQAAVEAARPILDGKMTCGEVPDRTYPLVVLPLLRLGKVERAARLYKTGYRMIRQNPKFIASKGYYLAFLALTGNFNRAQKLLERHFAEALRTASKIWQFEFFVAARLYLRRLQATNTPFPPLRVPEELRPTLGEATDAGPLTDWLDAQLQAIATALDTRNGNDGYAKRVAWYQEQDRFATDFPLGN